MFGPGDEYEDHDAVRDAEEKGELESDEAEAIHAELNRDEEEAKSNDWPDENMDGEDDTPFGTGD